MNFALSEEQRALQELVRQFLAENAPLSAVRERMSCGEPFDAALWRRVAGELGLTAMSIDEDYGGLGLGAVERTVVMEEMGRALFTGPFLSTVCLAAPLWAAAGSASQKETVLSGIASGKLLSSVAWMEPGGDRSPAGVRLRARRDGAGWVLDGDKTRVLDGHLADWLIVAARVGPSASSADISLFAVPGDAKGLTRQRVPSVDQTRSFADLSLRQVHLPGDALVGLQGEGWPVLQRAIDVAACALAAEQLGAAEACMDMSVAYAKVREQFGRPIGSFQAIKHRCADMLVQVESARSAAYFAGWAAGSPSGDVASAAALAQAYCSDALFFCAAECIQVHGGIGFTWEHDAHLFFKRAQSAKTLLGSPVEYRERVAEELGL